MVSNAAQDAAQHKVKVELTLRPPLACKRSLKHMEHQHTCPWTTLHSVCQHDPSRAYDSYSESKVTVMSGTARKYSVWNAALVNNSDPCQCGLRKRPLPCIAVASRGGE